MLGVALRAIPIFQGPTLTRVLACREGRLRAKSSPAMRPSKRAHRGESSRGFRSPPWFYSLGAGGECTGFGRTIASQKRGGPQQSGPHRGEPQPDAPEPGAPHRREPPQRVFQRGKPDRGEPQRGGPQRHSINSSRPLRRVCLGHKGE
jgi:hypothetical protein